MEQQNYSNHSRYVKGYHYLLGTLLPLGLIVAAVNVYRHVGFEALLSCILILWLFVCALLMGWYLRTFALKAQDRAIRAEESLRYFILSGKAIDKRLTMSQIIALRFASDEEFLMLAEKAATENLSNKDIKQAVINWRADHHRA
jgi:Family of unknown function (DUF6526)